MKIKKQFIYLFLIAIPLLSFTTHKYYLSLTQIEFKEKSKSLQIIINVFMDDIELALNKDNNIDLKLTTKQELKDNDKYFKTYLNNKLSFKIDGVKKSFNYIGKEYDGDLVFFYLEIEDIPEVKNIEVSNKILIKYFEDQQNLVKTKIGKINKSVLLTKDKTQSTLKH